MHLLKISDLTRKDILSLLKRAIHLKNLKKTSAMPYAPLKGKTLLLIFEKPSTRTRLSFEGAMSALGGNAIFMSPSDSQIGKGEPIKDTARVISRYVHGVVIRTFGHASIEEFARYSTIPVINGLTDLHHPCQVLADIMTVMEKKGSYEGLNIAWIGDGNNMANSWLEAANILGFHLKVACPKGYGPDKKIMARIKGRNIEICKTLKEAALNSDVLNTDVWASMGQEGEIKKRRKAFKGYRIDSKVISLAKKDSIVMHCLPAHRGEEITDEAIEGSHSVVWDQAENRLHIQKAILERLL